MFKELKEINARPKPFEFYTADELWADEHTSKQMLEYHLNESIDVSSRNKSFIERSVGWIVTQFGVDNKSEIVDFGCGPGLYATKLAEKGAKVTGVDFSENSLRHAKQVAKEEGLDIEMDDESTEHIRDMASEAPVIKLVNHFISQAIEIKASDIHIEPFADDLILRYRIDGVLHDFESPPKRLHSAITSRIKIMAKLDAKERDTFTRAVCNHVISQVSQGRAPRFERKLKALDAKLIAED